MSDRDKKLLVYLGALIILALAYFLCAKPFLDKLDVLSNEKTQLQNELTQKRADFENKEKYEQGITEAKDRIQTIIDEFPEDNSDEKSIMFVSDAEAEVPIWFNQVKFAEETKNMISSAEGEEGEVQSASEVEAEAEQEAVAAAEGEEVEAGSGRGNSEGEEQVPDAGAEEGSAGVSDLMYRDTELGLSFEVTYDGFKNLLAYVRDYKDRMVIKQIDVSYDDGKGILTGTIVLSQYAILGPGRVLPEVETGVEDLGTENVFKNRNHGGSIIDVLLKKANDLLDKIMDELPGVTEEEAEADFFIKANGVTDNTHGKTIGRSDDLQEESYLTSDENASEDVKFRVSGSDGNYTVKYTIGDNDHKEKIEKESGKPVYLRIISTERMSDSDEVSISLHVINKSDTEIIVSVEGDDNNSPRVDIVEKSGEVTVK